MLKYWQILCFLCLFGFTSAAQISDNPNLEKDVKYILSLINKANAGQETPENTTKLYEEAVQKSYEALDKYDLSCAQKGRLFLKIGSTHFYNYEDNKAIEILRDSTLGNWLNCPELEQKRLWDPAVLLFDLYILNNRLSDAGEISRFIDSQPKITEGVAPKNIQIFYSSLGYFAAEINDKTLSTQSLQKAMALLKDTKDASLNFSLHNDFANSLYRLEDYSNSIIQYEKAISYAKTDEQKVTVIVNYTELLIKKNQIKKAESLLNSIHDLVYKDTRFYRYKMIFLQRKATIKNEQGAYKEAIALMEEANQEIKEKKDANVSRAVNLSKMASSYYGLKQYETGDKKVSEAINLLLATNEKVDILKGESIGSVVSYNFRELLSILTHLVEEKLELEDPQTAISILNEVQKLVDNNKQALSGESSKIFQTSSIYPIYEKAIDKLVGLYTATKDETYLNQAIQLSLTNKGNILTDIINENQIYENELSEGEYSRFKQLKYDKSSAESNVANSKSDKLDSLNTVYLSTVRIFNTFQDSLFKVHESLNPKLQQNTSNLDVEEILQYLANDKAYLEIFSGQNAVYLFTLSKKEKNVFKVPMTEAIRNEFKSYSTNIYEYNTKGDFYNQSKTQYNLFYKAAFDYFKTKGIKDIITSSDGIFHFVPIETFWNGESFLIEDFDISYVLSNNQLKSQNEKYTKDYLGFGTSYTPQLNDHIQTTTNRSDIQLPPLQLSEEEIDNGYKIMGGKSYSGKNATKDNFLKSSQENSGIIHLAMHGIVLNNNKSGIIFYDGNEDFILDQLELRLLKLKNKLTILSACHSGGGEVFKGEGIRSLARSFLYAGSKSVISSLWEASDVSNEEIMSSLLGGISKGNTIHQSLNQAKRDYLKNAPPYAQHPAYWGNMVYVGINEKSSSSKWPYILLSFALIAFVFVFYKFKK